MALNVAVQMDPIERINIRGDSTFAMLLEAQARGHTLSYYTPDRLAQYRVHASSASTSKRAAQRRHLPHKARARALEREPHERHQQHDRRGREERHDEARFALGASTQHAR